SAHTDRDGVFTIPSIDPKAEVRLSAEAPQGVTARAVAAKPGGDEVRLVVSPAHAAAAAGRVVGPTGQPVAGARVRVTARGRGTRDEDEVNVHVIHFADRDHVRAAADGRFHSPRQLPPDLEYQIEADAPGFAPSRTEWRKPAGGEVVFPDVVLDPLPRLVTVEGRVIDRQGRAVAGVPVFQSGDGPRPTRTTTDADGRFRLPGVVAGRAFLFVEGDGLRFRGYPIDAGGGPVELTADRPGDPPPAERRTLPLPVPVEEAKAQAKRLVARKILGLIVGQFTGAAPDRSYYQLLTIVPRV